MDGGKEGEAVFIVAHIQYIHTYTESPGLPWNHFLALIIFAEVTTRKESFLIAGLLFLRCNFDFLKHFFVSSKAVKSPLL